jgi:hypothetical protein
MKLIKNLTNLRAGTVIFILFFGISALEAIRTRNWMSVTYWAVLGVIFVLLDGRKKQPQS